MNSSVHPGFRPQPRADLPRAKALWSVFAIADGFLTYIVLVMALTFVVSRLMDVPTDAPTYGYNVVSVIFSVAVATFAGWVTARVTRARAELSPLHHAIAVAVLLLLWNAVDIPKAVGGPESWYPVALTILTPIACILGASRTPPSGRRIFFY